MSHLTAVLQKKVMADQGVRRIIDQQATEKLPGTAAGTGATFSMSQAQNPDQAALSAGAGKRTISGKSNCLLID